MNAQVILRAALDWVHYRNHRDPIKRRLSVRAYVWLFEESAGTMTDRLDRFMAFENVCDRLDLEPKRVREWVRRLTVDAIRRLYSQ